jgi:DNA-binding GntR family transcriptional regulator
MAESKTGTPTAGEEGAFRSIVDRHERPFRTVADMAYETIREGILTGVFKPGERLRQDQLAEAIGVSRIPVRSALLKLESNGLVTFHPYRGAVVNTLSVNELREIYEIRGVLEAHALRKAMNAMTPGRLERLEQLAVELNAVEGSDEFLRRRTDFYRELYDHEHQPQIVALIERLREDAARYMVERNLDYARRPGERDHAQVLNFLQTGDVEGALRWLADHLERVCEQLVAHIQESEQTRS